MKNRRTAERPTASSTTLGDDASLLNEMVIAANAITMAAHASCERLRKRFYGIWVCGGAGLKDGDPRFTATRTIVKRFCMVGGNTLKLVPKMIVEGGGPGAMMAAAQGAIAARRKGYSVIGVGHGVNIPGEPKDLTRDLEYLHHNILIREMFLLGQSNAVLIVPGGSGTVDELTMVFLNEALNRRAGLVHRPRPIVCYTEFTDVPQLIVEALKKCEDEKLARPGEHQMIKIAPTKEEVIRILEADFLAWCGENQIGTSAQAASCIATA